MPSIGDRYVLLSDQDTDSGARLPAGTAVEWVGEGTYVSADGCDMCWPAPAEVRPE